MEVGRLWVVGGFDHELWVVGFGSKWRLGEFEGFDRELWVEGCI